MLSFSERCKAEKREAAKRKASFGENGGLEEWIFEVVCGNIALTNRVRRLETWGESFEAESWADARRITSVLTINVNYHFFFRLRLLGVEEQFKEQQLEMQECIKEKEHVNALFDDAKISWKQQKADLEESISVLKKNETEFTKSLDEVHK